jgi:hypothetical protein
MEGKAAKVHLAIGDDAIHLRVPRVFRRKDMYVLKVPYKKVKGVQNRSSLKGV